MIHDTNFNKIAFIDWSQRLRLTQVKLVNGS
jgi:hypothetical protein